MAASNKSFLDGLVAEVKTQGKGKIKEKDKKKKSKSKSFPSKLAKPS